MLQFFRAFLSSAALTVLFSACASIGNTPAQDLAWERWEKCKVSGVTLSRITPEGQIWVTHLGDHVALHQWQECDRQTSTEQTRRRTAAPPAGGTSASQQSVGQVETPQKSSSVGAVSVPAASKATEPKPTDRPEDKAGAQIKTAYFTADPPAFGTTIRGDLSNAPQRVDTFDAGQHHRVVFFYGIYNQQKQLDAEVRWFDPLGGAVYKQHNRDNHENATTTWRYYTSTRGIGDLPGSGLWKVELWLDGVLGGEYFFRLTGKPDATARNLEAEADRPQYRVGDQWILSDGLSKVVDVDGNGFQISRGPDRIYHYTSQGHLKKVVERGQVIVEFDPAYPLLQWPLRVGKQWSYEGRIDNEISGRHGPLRQEFRVSAFEDVATPAGIFPAFKIVSGSGTYWYSPSARTVVRLLITSIPTYARDFELVAIPDSPPAAKTIVEPSVIGQQLLPADLKAYYGASWAVIIGIDRYQAAAVPRLSFAVADAEAVARYLPSLGFPKERTVLLINSAATKGGIERAIYGSLRQMAKDDRLFVFFAGHGETEPVRDGQEGYLLPYDADLANLPLTGLPMRELAQIGRRLPVKHVLFALDNCFSGYAARRSANLVAGDTSLSGLTAEPVVQILTAGTQGQAAVEEGGHGIFTKHLLKGLEGWADPDGTGLTALKLATFIQERVVRESGGKQTPQYGKLDGEGEFLFRPPRR